MKNLFLNYSFDKSRIKSFLFWFLKNYGETQTIKLLDEMKSIGFGYATKAGVSLGIEDLKVPPRKSLLLGESEKTVYYTKIQAKRGDITAIEKFQRLIDTWHQTSETLKTEVVQYFETTNLLNPVYMMAFSGARGNLSQVRQLVGMRGLMSDPNGQILEFPIRSNFREGISLTEYIISSYGARKGIVDTALRTANAGYLTRRLVDVAQHVIVSTFDCGTKKGIYVSEMKDGLQTIYSLENRLIGRVLAKDVVVNNLKIGSRNQEICRETSGQISKKFAQVFIRSPLTCETRRLVCQLCYGWSLGQNSLVSIGEAVGVIAAQSIGEPGTQLTMRTFHTGGVFSGDLTEEVMAPEDGVVTYADPIAGVLIRTPQGQIAFLTKTDGELKFTPVSEKATSKTRLYKLPPFSILYSRQGQKVLKKDLMAQISTVATQKKQKDEAEQIIYSDLEGVFYHAHMDLLESQNEFEDPFFEAQGWGYVWILSGKRYNLPFKMSIFPHENDFLSEKNIASQVAFKQISANNYQILEQPNNQSIRLHQSIFEVPLNEIFYKKLGYLSPVIHPTLSSETLKFSHSLNSLNSFRTKENFKNQQYQVFCERLVSAFNPNEKNLTTGCFFLNNKLKKEDSKKFDNTDEWGPKLTQFANYFPYNAFTTGKIHYSIHFHTQDFNSFKFERSRISFSNILSNSKIQSMQGLNFSSLNQTQFRSSINYKWRLTKGQSTKLDPVVSWDFVGQKVQRTEMFTLYKSSLTGFLETSLEPECSVQTSLEKWINTLVTIQNVVFEKEKKSNLQIFPLHRMTKKMPKIPALFELVWTKTSKSYQKLNKMCHVKKKKIGSKVKTSFSKHKVHTVSASIGVNSQLLKSNIFSKVNQCILFSFRISKNKSKTNDFECIYQFGSFVKIFRNIHQNVGTKGWFYCGLENKVNRIENFNSLNSHGFSFVNTSYFIESRTEFNTNVKISDFNWVKNPKTRYQIPNLNFDEKGWLIQKVNEQTFDVKESLAQFYKFDQHVEETQNGLHLIELYNGQNLNRQKPLLPWFLSKPLERVKIQPVFQIPQIFGENSYSKFIPFSRKMFLDEKSNFFFCKTPYHLVTFDIGFQNSHELTNLTKTPIIGFERTRLSDLPFMPKEANLVTFANKNVTPGLLTTLRSRFTLNTINLSKFISKSKQIDFSNLGFIPIAASDLNLNLIAKDLSVFMKPITTFSSNNFKTGSLNLALMYQKNLRLFEPLSNPNQFLQKEELSTTQNLSIQKFQKVDPRRPTSQNFVFKPFSFLLSSNLYLKTDFLSPFKGEILKNSISEWSNSRNKSQLIFLTKKDFIALSRKDSKPISTSLTNEPSMQMETIHKYPLSQKDTSTGVNSKLLKSTEMFVKFEEKIYKVKGLRISARDLTPRLDLGGFVVPGDSVSQTAVSALSGQIIHKNKNKVTIRKGQPIFLSSGAILHYYHGDFIPRNKSIITLPYQRLKTGDIVQGIPKIEQFFEARTTKAGRKFNESMPSLLIALYRHYRRRLTQKKAVRQSFYKIQQILVDGVQRVYRSQGVSIADKHLEIIVRQMTTKVRIIDGGQTGFFPGELLDCEFVEQVNRLILKKISYEPVLLGITRASLEAESFLAAASFQQTSRVLSRSALYKKKDFLKGLKENVILGNLMPAGTGYFEISKGL